MKVVLLNSYSFDDLKGGAENVNTLLADYLKRKAKIYMITTRVNKSNKNKCYKANGIIHIKYDPFWPGPKPRINKKITNFLWHICQLISPLGLIASFALFRRLKPDFALISNVYEFTIGYIWAIKMMKIKYRIWIHDYNWFCIHSNAYNTRTQKNCTKHCLKCKVTRVIHTSLLSKSRKIFLSSISKLTYCNLLNLNHSDVIIPNACVYYEKLLPTRNNYDPKKIRFGFLGSPIYIKGLDLLLRIFDSQNYDKQVSIELNIGGANNGRYYLDLKKAYSGNKRINFLGHINTHIFFQNNDVLVLPSRWRDTYPGVCVEAILAKNIIIIPEHVGAIDLADFFPNQIYKYNGNLNTLTKQIKNVISTWPKAKEDISENNDALQIFSPEVWADQIYSIIKSDTSQA